MFDALKNLGGLGNPMELLRKAGEMRQQMEKLQEELARTHVTADAGGGMVSATVTGKFELIKLQIDPRLVGDVTQKEMLEDLIVAAVGAAQAKAADTAKQKMQQIAGNLGLPPGMMGG